MCGRYQHVCVYVRVCERVPVRRYKHVCVRVRMSTCDCAGGTSISVCVSMRTCDCWSASMSVYVRLREIRACLCACDSAGGTSMFVCVRQCGRYEHVCVRATVREIRAYMCVCVCVRASVTGNWWRWDNLSTSERRRSYTQTPSGNILYKWQTHSVGEIQIHSVMRQQIFQGIWTNDGVENSNIFRMEKFYYLK